MEGCDYDICEDCRSCKLPDSGADTSGDNTQAPPFSFLAVQQEQQQEAARSGASALGFAHLDGVETRPYYTEVECHAFLLNYATLFRVPGSTQNKKILLLDDLLTQVLYGSSSGGQAPPAEVHQKSALSLLLKRMRLSHKIGMPMHCAATDYTCSRRVGLSSLKSHCASPFFCAVLCVTANADGLAAKKGVGERSSVRSGLPNPLHVKTESRKNHNLTLVTGLENFGIDPHALADMLKRKLGANTTVGEWKAKSGAAKAEVAVSGLWEKSVRPATH